MRRFRSGSRIAAPRADENSETVSRISRASASAATRGKEAPGRTPPAALNTARPASVIDTTFSRCACIPGSAERIISPSEAT